MRLRTTSAALAVGACVLVLCANSSCSLFTQLAPQFAAQETMECSERRFTVLFDGASSTPLGRIAEFHWDFGDGSKGTGVTTKHSYAHGGTYQVTLTVRTTGGQSAAATQSVVVMGPPPRVGLLVGSSREGGSLRAFANWFFFSCPTGDCTFHIDFGDGETRPPRKYAYTAEHVYAGLGPYTIRVTITDKYGRTSSSAAKVVNESPLWDYQLITFDSPSTITVSVGDVLLLTLWGNPTTGYLWEIEPSFDPSVIQPVGENYRTDPACGDRSGCGGVYTFRFQAVGVGSSPLELVYWQPWTCRRPEPYFRRTVVVVDSTSPGASSTR